MVPTHYAGTFGIVIGVIIGNSTCGHVGGGGARELLVAACCIYHVTCSAHISKNYGVPGIAARAITEHRVYVTPARN